MVSLFLRLPCLIVAIPGPESDQRHADAGAPFITDQTSFFKDILADSGENEGHGTERPGARPDLDSGLCEKVAVTFIVFLLAYIVN